MAVAVSPVWPLVASVSHFGGAGAALAAGLWLLPRRARFGQAGKALVASLAMTFAWCLTVAIFGIASVPGAWALALRDVACLFAVYRLLAGDGRVASVAQPDAVAGAADRQFAFHVSVLLEMLVTVGALVLVHNLYVGAGNAYRAVLRWPASGLALVWGYELNLFTTAYLGDHWPVELAALHGFVDMAFAAILMVGASRRREELRLRPSRAVTFHSFSLLLIGAYFLAMAAVAQSLAYWGGDHAGSLQFGFLIVASGAALLMLPSTRLRGWLKVTLTKHLFQHRFDYRGEWLRFNRTIGRQGQDAPPLHQRVIQAVADITDSPGGLLLTPDESLAAWVVNSAGLQFFARAPVSPDAPLHAYAVSDALFVSCGGMYAAARPAST